MKHKDDNTPKSIEDIPADIIAEINSYITSNDPNVFMPHICNLDQKIAMLILELTSRGKLSPSYESYAWVLLVAMTGNPENAAKLFKKGYDFLKEEMNQKN